MPSERVHWACLSLRSYLCKPSGLAAMPLRRIGWSPEEEELSMVQKDLLPSVFSCLSRRSPVSRSGVQT